MEHITYQCTDCQGVETLHILPDCCSLCQGRMLPLEAQAEAKPTAAIIAVQNDRFRRSMGDDEDVKGRLVYTRGICGLGVGDIGRIVATVRVFDDFTPDNDPYGDHSFGAFDYAGARIYWKIALYDVDYLYGSEAPHDPARTRRVLTILFASEY